MKLCVFCVFDSKIQAYLPPMFFRSKGEAIRSFTAACNSSDHQFNLHSEDYVLFDVGIWDDELCSFDTLPTPNPIGKAIQFVNIKDKEVA